MMSKIASGRREYAAIFYGLESVLFYRLGSASGESHLRKDLSSIFEQLQLSESLGKLYMLVKRRETLRMPWETGLQIRRSVSDA
jgi:hypothetical protein